MSVDFYLAELSEKNYLQGGDPMFTPDYYRRMMRLGNPQIAENERQKIWDRYSGPVIDAFLKNVMKHVDMTDECFLTIHPPSNITYFIEPIREAIQRTFPNTIDISNCFLKDQEYDDHKSDSPSELSEFVLQNEDQIQEIDKNKKIFIYDDVYGSGQTMEVLNFLLDKYNFSNSRYSGVILKSKGSDN
ncbi:MAG: hypothetical protein R8G66_19640 [Cytophagales bacterium]|nr:hypothetical protein [Cytophagales bacterium]